MTLEYENLLLLKWSQYLLASNIVITEKNKASQTYHICQGQTIWNKVIDFTVEPAVHCDVLAVKNTSLDDDNDECK